MSSHCKIVKVSSLLFEIECKMREFYSCVERLPVNERKIVKIEGKQSEFEQREVY